jgi:mannose-1-phosphate guanylyltransferase
MVMAAGLGTRLRPLTYEIPKPMVPVANRPVMELILRLLAEQGFRQVVCNLHWFPETIESRFGDGSELGIELRYIHEPELTGTAGGVRAARDFLTAEGGPFVVLAGDALTDIDLEALVDAHRRKGGVATLATKRVANVSEYGVVVVDGEDRVQGFQEKPDPAEALSDLANCMIYVFEPEIFDYFADDDPLDFALDVFPALLGHDVPFFVHATDAYWNDVGSLPEYLQGNLDVVLGHVGVASAGRLLDGDASGALGNEVESSGPILIAEGADVAAGARVDGPLVIGPRARIAPGARVRESVLLPGATVGDEALVAGAIVGRRGALA